MAAVDLDKDGVDEIVIHALYWEAGNYKIFKMTTDGYKEVYNSYCFGLCCPW